MAAGRFISGILPARPAPKALNPFTDPTTMPDTHHARAPSLTLRDVTLRYGADAPVIDRLSMALAGGESLAIVGASGCGKSTLLSAMAGLRPVDGGVIEWSRPVRSSFVWQQLALFPWKRVLENLTLPLVTAGVPKAECLERGREMLVELGLEGLEKRFPAELSGGQRQRLALGRALIAEPEVLFLDEPFSALDALLRERLQDVLLGLEKRHPVERIMVTHDIAEAVLLGERILVLAAKPSRVLGLIRNPVYTPDPSPEHRTSEAFYAVCREIHALLRGAESNEGGAR